jgi:hypothetical protein
VVDQLASKPTLKLDPQGAAVIGHAVQSSLNPVPAGILEHYHLVALEFGPDVAVGPGGLQRTQRDPPDVFFQYEFQILCTSFVNLR